MSMDEIVSVTGTVTEWLIKLKHFLLSKKGVYSDEDKTHFNILVLDIISEWEEVTHIIAFPKLHTLLHAAEFVEREGFLADASESCMESSHGQIARAYHQRHLT